jgi:hypothetical protein
MCRYAAKKGPILKPADNLLIDRGARQPGCPFSIQMVYEYLGSRPLGSLLFFRSPEANAWARFGGRVQQLLQVFKDEPYVTVMLLELAALFDHFLFHPL